MQFFAQVDASGHWDLLRLLALPVLQEVVPPGVWMSRYSKSRTTEVFCLTQPPEVVHFHVGRRGWTSGVEGGAWASATAARSGTKMGLDNMLVVDGRESCDSMGRPKSSRSVYLDS